MFQVIHVYEKKFSSITFCCFTHDNGNSGLCCWQEKTAEKKTENENVVEVTPSKGTTPEELAAIQVLSEICPSLIGKKDAEFAQGYERLVKDYLPNEADPVAALENVVKTRASRKS